MSRQHIPIPVINVTLNATGAPMVINASDFDETKYTKVAAGRAKLEKDDKPAADEPPAKTLAEELGALTVAQLKAHALYGKVEDAEQYTKKAPLIAAMLEAAKAA